MAALVLAAACARTERDTRAPQAEFLLASGDSTYWVSAGAQGLQAHGAPLLLARYDGRFHELYVVDDDQSYADALLVGQGIYSRDLISGDSALVYTDTLVNRVAGAYAAAHPDEDPLEPDDPVSDQPVVVATSDISLLDVAGPYLSMEYHADTHERRRDPFHTTWRSVVDLRDGRPITLDRLVDSAQAARLVAQGRRAYGAVLDSVRRGGRDMRELITLVLSQVQFDPGSFTLGRALGRPTVAFAGRIAGPRDGVGTLPVPPLALDSTPWWGAIRTTVPTDSAGVVLRWTHGSYTVVARADTADSVATVSLVDAAQREWPVAQVHLPLHQVFWLDRPAVDSATRHALERAFNDASMYDEDVRVASRPNRPDSFHDQAQARHPYGEGKPARIFAAHDAAGRQQPGARVRRRGALDDGQDGGHRRAAALPNLGGDRVH